MWIVVDNNAMKTGTLSMRKMEQSAEQQKASTRLESSLETVNLIEFQAIKQVKTGTVDTRTTMGVNNTPSPEGRRRSRLDLPKAGPSDQNSSFETVKFQGQGQQPKGGSSRDRSNNNEEAISYDVYCIKFF